MFLSNLFNLYFCCRLLLFFIIIYCELNVACFICCLGDNSAKIQISCWYFLQPLDYEKKSSYTVEIQVQNTHVDTRFMSSGSKAVTTVRISVEDVDEPPLFDKASYVMEVKEDTAAHVAVGSVSAMDPDGARSMVK